jgi:hypothetical protein
MKQVIETTEVNETVEVINELLKTENPASLRDVLQEVTNHYLADDRIDDMQRIEWANSLNSLNQTLQDIDRLATTVN